MKTKKLIWSFADALMRAIFRLRTLIGKDSCGAASYTFLGTAEYIRRTGSKLMDVIWKLDNEIPAKYLKKTMQVMG